MSIKNIQGDIFGIYSNISQLFREYTYDAWGNITGVYDEYGNPVKHLNDVAYYNPFRYRGYYYDNETGLYYLQSRYYDPEVGRFINADDVDYLGVGNRPLSYNLFAYCENNPVNNSDPSGNLSINAFSLLLDIAFTAISFLRLAKIGYDVIGSGLTYYAKKRGFRLFYDKLMYSAVPKFKGIFSKGFTLLRTAIWRVTGITMSNVVTSALNNTLDQLRKILLKNSNRINYVIKIALRLTSLGSAIALVLDFLSDGSINEKIVYKGRVIVC